MCVYIHRKFVHVCSAAVWTQCPLSAAATAEAARGPATAALQAANNNL